MFVYMALYTCRTLIVMNSAVMIYCIIRCYLNLAPISKQIIFRLGISIDTVILIPCFFSQQYGGNKSPRYHFRLLSGIFKHPNKPLLAYYSAAVKPPGYVLRCNNVNMACIEDMADTELSTPLIWDEPEVATVQSHWPRATIDDMYGSRCCARLLCVE